MQKWWTKWRAFWFGPTRWWLIVTFVFLELLGAGYFFWVLRHFVPLEYPLPLSHWESLAGEYRPGPYDAQTHTAAEGEWLINGDMSGRTDAFRSPSLHLPAGTYTLYVEYTADYDQDLIFDAQAMQNLYGRQDPFILQAGSQGKYIKFVVPDETADLHLVVRFSGEGNFSLHQVMVTSNHASVRLRLLRYLVWSLLLDVLYLGRRWWRRRDIGWLLALIVFASWPLLYPGIHGGHDLIFHLSRIESLTQSLKRGQFLPKLMSGFVSDYGYPLGVFYNNILLYLPVFLTLSGVSLITAYKIYLLAINVITVLSGYWAFKQLFPRRRTALLVTAAWTLAGYRFLDIFVRSAVGEASALTFIPLIIVPLHQLLTQEKPAKRRNIAMLTIGLTGLFSTHILTIEILAICSIVAVVFCWRKFFRREGGVAIALTALGLSLLLNAYFLVPFLDYTFDRSVGVTATLAGSGTPPLIQHAGLAPLELFTFFSSFIDHYWLKTPGLVLVGALLVAIYLWSKHKLLRPARFYTIISLVLLGVATYFFPWHYLALHTGALGRFLVAVQFPWRYLAVACCSLAILLGYILENFATNKNVPWFVAGALFISTSAIFSQYLDEGNWLHTYDFAALGGYVISVGDYLRPHANPTSLSGIYRSDHLDFQVRSREAGLSIIDVQSTDQPGELYVPLYNYKGYQAITQQGEKLTIHDGLNDEIAVSVPASFSGTIRVEYQEPASWRWAQLISLLTWCGVMFYLFFYYCAKAQFFTKKGKKCINSRF